MRQYKLSGIGFLVVVALAGLFAIRSHLAPVGWAVVVVGLLTAALALYFRLKVYVAERNRDAALASLKVKSAELSHNFLEAGLHHQAVQMAEGRLFLKSAVGASFAPHTKVIADRLALPAPADLVDNEPLPVLAELLPQAQRVLISGGQNAGKTTICQWVAHHKLQQGGRVIVIDSHATPARWPHGCEVIGAGRDHAHIEALLKWMMREMDRRFLEQAQGIVGERGHEIINIVSDEWTLLPEIIPNIEQYTVPLLTETRKAGFDFYLASHDVTVGALGIKGRGGLRKAFDFAVLCDYDFESGDRQTFVNFMKSGAVRERDNIEYEAPGPFVSRMAAVPLALPAVSTIAPAETTELTVFGRPDDLQWIVADDPEPAADPTPTADEQVIIDAFIAARDENGGKVVWSHVTRQLGWTATGPNNQRIKTVLDKWDIKY